MSEKIKYWLFYSLVWLLSLLPFTILFAISDVLYFLAAKVLKYRRKVIRENLQKVFPEKTAEERLEIERKYYHHLCDVVVETVKIMHLSDKHLQRRVEFHNLNIISKYLSNGQPVMVFMGHYGNWEWIQEFSSRINIDCNIGALYRPVRSQAVNRLMLAIRNRWPVDKIAQKETMRKIVEYRRDKKPFVIGFIADQRPNGAVLDNWTDFLGQRTAFVVGAEAIGRKVNAAYAFFEVSKPKRGHYVITAKELDVTGTQNRLYPYAVRSMQMLEDNIRQQPELWLWSHKRWSIPRYCKITDKEQNLEHAE